MDGTKPKKAIERIQSFEPPSVWFRKRTCASNSGEQHQPVNRALWHAPYLQQSNKPDFHLPSGSSSTGIACGKSVLVSDMVILYWWCRKATGNYMLTREWCHSWRWMILYILSRGEITCDRLFSWQTDFLIFCFRKNTTKFRHDLILDLLPTSRFYRGGSMPDPAQAPKCLSPY